MGDWDPERYCSQDCALAEERRAARLLARGELDLDAALAADAKARADHRRALEKAEASTRRPRIERYEPYPEAEPPVPQKSPWRKTGPGKQLKAMMRRIDQNAWNKMITLEK
mgnify:CR=1 FL=1